MNKAHNARGRGSESKAHPGAGEPALHEDVLASVSHELRTQLSVILGFSDLLLQEIAGPLNPEQRAFSRQIHHSGEQLLAALNDLLEWSRLEAGTLPLRPELLDLGAASDEAIEAFEPLAGEGNLEIIRHFQSGLRVWADPARMRQILRHLLSNAVKFTPAGGKVRLEACSSSGWTRLSVCDTGAGIAAGDLPFVFESFRHVGRRPSGSNRGAGLGLAITKYLVEHQGGRIEIQSRLDAGTCVTLHLPDAPPGAASRRKPRRPPAA